MSHMTAQENKITLKENREEETGKRHKCQRGTLTDIIDIPLCFSHEVDILMPPDTDFSYDIKNKTTKACCSFSIVPVLGADWSITVFNL